MPNRGLVQADSTTWSQVSGSGECTSTDEAVQWLKKALERCM